MFWISGLSIERSFGSWRCEMGLLPQGFTLAINVLGVAIGCP